jgi:predicted Zn-dependent protease with MMP-like domain
VVEVSRSEFERMVGDALDEIPDALANELENVAVMVEDWPTPAQLSRVGARGTLLGLYEGVPLTRRGPLSYSGVSPDRITIFQGTISRRARNVEELAAQVRVTVLHEVGHYFGMDDARLHELGWA